MELFLVDSKDDQCDRFYFDLVIIALKSIRLEKNGWTDHFSCRIWFVSFI